MSGRLSLTPIIRGHWKGLTNDLGNGTVVPDWWARGALVVPSLTVLVWGLLSNWQVLSPTAVLSGVSLLSGGMLSAFAQLSTLRSRLAEYADRRDVEVDQSGIDEAVAHLLLALLICVFTAAITLIGINIGHSPTDPSTLHDPWAAVALAALTYLGALFFILVPKLYSAYISTNDVRSDLNGFHRSASRTRSRLRR